MSLAEEASPTALPMFAVGGGERIKTGLLVFESDPPLLLLP